MDIFTAIKGFLAAISASIVAVFGAQAPATQIVGPVAAIEQVLATSSAPSATATPAEVQPKQPSAAEIYQLGVMVGKLQAAVEAAERASTTQPSMTTTVPNQTEPASQTSGAGQSQPAPSTTGPAVAPSSGAAVSQARIEIISPYGGKGLGRQYKADPNAPDEAGYVELGAVVYDDAGNVVKDAVVTVTATDEKQNKTMNGTGNYSGSQNVYYYPYHYDFTAPGDHTITFSSGSLSKSVTLNAQ